LFCLLLALRGQVIVQPEPVADRLAGLYSILLLIPVSAHGTTPRL
jgi:hypothetical protein